MTLIDDSAHEAHHATVPPAAAGVRLPWSAVPTDLRDKACALAGGGEVVEALPQTGGFSPGAAVRVRLSTGRRIFIKAVSADQNPDSPDYYRQEARYTAALPEHAPVPRLLGVVDERGWVVLVFDDIDGVMPDAAWRPDELRRVLDAFSQLADLLDPTPVEAPLAAERLAGSFQGWRACRQMRDDGPQDALDWLDPWARRHLDALAELEVHALEAVAGTTLIHTDIRADNILMAPDRVYFVDWPWACVGAPWVDLVLLVPSVWMHVGPEIARLVTEHPVVAKADPADVTAVAAAFTGYLVDQGHQPAPPGLPTLRAFQNAAAVASLAWIKGRLPGWE